MSTDQHSIIPKPLNPRNADALIQQLSPSDRVRITITNLPRTILTVREVHPLTSHAPQLVLTAPPITTTAQDELQQATYHCTASHFDSPMTIIEYTHTATDTTARCIGSLTIVRDYETEESVDDDSPNLVAEASNAGKQLFETIQRAEQNTELVNFREKRAESQQVEDKYLDILEHEF